MVQGTDSNWPVIMFDLHSEAVRHAAIDVVVGQGVTVCTDIIQLIQDTALNQSRAAGLMIAPSYWTDPQTGEKTLTGLPQIVFNWDQARASAAIISQYRSGCWCRTSQL